VLPPVSKRLESELLHILRDQGYHRQLSFSKTDFGYSTTVKDSLGNETEISISAENNPLGAGLHGRDSFTVFAKLNEFHYVTNVKFSDKFKTEVDQANLSLVHDYIAEHNGQFETPEGIKELAHLHEVEKASMPEGVVDPSKLGDLANYSEAVKEFAAQYKISQVEVCENVTYGT
jgi:hypothetical protein